MLTALPLLLPAGIWLGLALTTLGLLWRWWRRTRTQRHALQQPQGLAAADATNTDAAPDGTAPTGSRTADTDGALPDAVGKRTERRWTRMDLAWLGALALFAGAEWWAGARFHHLDIALPLVFTALAGALFWLLLRRQLWSPAGFWGGLAVGGLGAGSWALFQRVVEGVARADSHAPLHAILFGNLSLLTGLMCLAGLGWAWQQPARRTWCVLLALGAAGGILASALSGTRGGWLALPFTLLVLWLTFVRHWPRYRRRTALLGVVTVTGLLYVIPQTGVEQRIDLAVSEARDYARGDARGSVGTRLEMYRGAWQLIRARPLRGYGHDGYQPAMGVLAEPGDVTRAAAQHPHAHNDLLDAWVRRGLPGLLAVVALLLVPMRFFAARLASPSPDVRAAAGAGLLVPVAFLDFGLSYSFFAYPSAVALFVAWIAAAAHLLPSR